MLPDNLPLDSAPQLCSLPVIHIAPYLTNSDGRGRLSTSAALHAACREFGFFYLDLTGFATPEETEDLAKLAREFFALPTEVKNQIHLGLQDNARGASKSDTNLRHPLIGATMSTSLLYPGPTPSMISSDLFV